VADIFCPALQADQSKRYDRLGLLHFSESEAPAVGNPDIFWSVDLQRQADGRWLISAYGQG
jgi:hypothetical protein